MKIRSLRIDAFGGLESYALEDLPPGLVVLHGPNEAGKSTLLAFIRGVLFGFPTGNTREPRYLPPGERKRSGRVELEQDGRTLIVERSAPPPGKRKLAVRFGDGAEANEAELARWLGHADAELYKSVFAFSLSELQGFESLGVSGIQERIFSAGITGAGNSARDALKQLEAQAHELLSQGRKKGRLLELVAASRAAAAVLEERRTAARGYAQLALVEQREGAALARLRERVEVERSEAARATKLLDLWRSVWSPLLAARERLAKLEEIAPFPADAKERLTSLRTDIAYFEKRVGEQAGDLERLDAELGALSPDEALSPPDGLEDVAELVAELELDRLAHRERVATHEELRRALVERDQRLAALVRDELGSEFDEERIAAFDASLSRANEARELRLQLAAAIEAESAIETRAARLQEETERLALREQRALTARDAVPVVPMEALEAREAALRQLRRELGECGALRRIASEREAGLEAVAQPRTLWRHLAAALCAGAAGLVAWAIGPGRAAVADALVSLQPAFDGWAPAVPGFLARALAHPFLASVVVAAGAALALALFAGALVSSRRHRRLVARGEDALAATRDALAERDRPVRTLLARFDLDAPPDDAGLDRLELELRRERDRSAEHKGHANSAHAYGEEIETLRREERSLADEGERVSEARERAEQEIDLWRRARGVPEAISIDQVPLLFETLRRARQLLEVRADARDTLARCDAAVRRWEDAARAVLARVDSSFADAAPEAVESGLGELAERCALDARRRDQRQPLLKRRLAIVEQRAENARRLEDKRAEFAALLGDGGAASEEEYRARLDVASQRAELDRKIEDCELELESRIGIGDEADALRAELEGGRVSEWEERLERASSQVRELEDEHLGAVRSHHDLRNRLAELGASADVAEAELELSQLGEELEQAVREWRRLRLARGLVRETLARFERERQPAVLRDASALFARITGGRYARVEQSAASDSFGESFVVADAGGVRRPLSDLSTGTAEQLYLCVRLGLIEEFARRSVSLPVAMDDVIVNFDDARAPLAARAFADFAAREDRQLLYFTCSSLTRDRIVEAAPEATVIELSGAPTPRS